MPSRPSGPRRRPPQVAPRHAGTAPTQKRLYKLRDHGSAETLDADVFAPAQRGGGWGPFAESFLRMNERALATLEVKADVGSSDAGVRVRLVPGGRAGAIPLRSAQTGNVAAGVVVEPRFGWSGVGSVLSQTGWAAAPEFLDGPLVPGSGREVPPWVLAGPVLARIAELLDALRRGYHTKEEVRQRPRGRILWDRYISESLTTGRWANLPCRYPELATDPLVRRMARWGVERVRAELAMVGGRDPVARLLLSLADDLLFRVRDVLPLVPRRADLNRMATGDRLLGSALRRGLEALGWVADERGLGGGREMDGLAWTLPLHQLWEHYVEALVRREAALVGGGVSVGRKRETVFPLEWTDPSHRSLGHLVPDIVVFTRTSVHIVDAKYKAHLAELDEQGWVRFTDDAREAHRADIHQVLAYASLYSADEVSASLVYPLRRATFEALAKRGRDRSVANLLHGARRVRLELRGVSFGANVSAMTDS
jgi:McrBC 5-methylcytosine restriction system component